MIFQEYWKSCLQATSSLILPLFLDLTSIGKTATFKVLGALDNRFYADPSYYPRNSDNTWALGALLTTKHPAQALDPRAFLKRALHFLERALDPRAFPRAKSKSPGVPGDFWMFSEVGYIISKAGP